MGMMKEIFSEMEEINEQLINIINLIKEMSDEFDLTDEFSEDFEWFEEMTDISWCLDEWGYNKSSVEKVVDAYYYDLRDLTDNIRESAERFELFQIWDYLDRIYDELDTFWSLDVDNYITLLD